jgi:hypothetical protein
VEPGNNETDDALRAACAGWPAARVLHGEATEIDDVTFLGLGGGVPVTPWDWNFDLTEQQAERMLTGLSPGAVLLVPSLPPGHADGGLGSAAVLHAIQRQRPRLVLCGTCTSAGARKPRGRHPGVQPRPQRHRDRPRRASVPSATCAIAVAAQAGQAYRSLPAISRPEGVF